MIYSYLVGSRLLLAAPTTDNVTDALVDPSAFTFRVVAASGLTGIYTWDGATWAVSESVIAVPSRLSLGIFQIAITVPYSNSEQGIWRAGWKSVANGSGKGEGSGELLFLAVPTGVL